MGMLSPLIYKPLWKLIFVIVVPYVCPYGNILTEDLYGSDHFRLIYHAGAYSFPQAIGECRSRISRLALNPVPDTIIDTVLQFTLPNDVNIWITGEDGDCIGLRSSCESFVETPYRRRCETWDLVAQRVSCNESYVYILCQSGPTTISTTSTTKLTTTYSATTILSTTPTTQSKSISTNILTTAVDKSYTPMPTDNKLSTTAQEEPTWLKLHLTIINGTGELLLGVAIADTKFLGLIVAIVSGVFFTACVIIGVCYLCYSKGGFKHKRYELVHGFSNNTIPYTAGDRGYGTSRSGKDSRRLGTNSQPNGKSHAKDFPSRMTHIPDLRDDRQEVHHQHSLPPQMPKSTEQVYINSRFISGSLPVDNKRALNRQIMSYEELPPPPPPPVGGPQNLTFSSEIFPAQDLPAVSESLAALPDESSLASDHLPPLDDSPYSTPAIPLRVQPICDITPPSQLELAALSAQSLNTGSKNSITLSHVNGNTLELTDNASTSHRADNTVSNSTKSLSTLNVESAVNLTETDTGCQPNIPLEPRIEIVNQPKVIPTH